SAQQRERGERPEQRAFQESRKRSTGGNHETARHDPVAHLDRTPMTGCKKERLFADEQLVDVGRARGCMRGGSWQDHGSRATRYAASVGCVFMTAAPAA